MPCNPDRGRDGIERLRTRTPERQTSVGIDQAVCLVDMLKEGWNGLSAVSAATGLAPADVVSTVVDLGTWLGQSVNAGAKATTVDFDRAVAQHRTGTDAVGRPTLFPGHSDGCVIVPPGFDRRSVGRDLGKAIAQIVTASPDEATLRRWLMRRYHRIHQVLSFELVALVHRLTQIGRLGEVDQLCERNGAFNAELARILVEAYDLMDVARADAVEAVDRIADPSVRNLSEVAMEFPRASWLNEAEFARLDRALDSGNEVLADAALAEFRRCVERGRARRASHGDVELLRPAGVTELLDAQVQRLAEREGLRTAAVEGTKADMVRSWVVASGQQPDADLLVAEGVRAERAGLGKEFREALARRAKGDLDWSAELNEALATVARV